MTSCSDIPELIESLSAVVALLPGDLIFTGTPAGIGWARDPRVVLKPGDTLTTYAEVIGEMTTTFTSSCNPEDKEIVMAKPKLVPHRLPNGPAAGDARLVLQGARRPHVVYQDEALSFMTFDDEHHRVALLHPPIPMEAKSATTAALHHSAYTFDTIDDLLERYTSLRDQGITPAVCVAHGVTTSMYYQDPDRNFVELQIDRFDDPDDATGYMNAAEYAADSVGPGLRPPRNCSPPAGGGASVEELSDRSWAVKAELANPLEVLMGG